MTEIVGIVEQAAEFLTENVSDPLLSIRDAISYPGAEFDTANGDDVSSVVEAIASLTHSVARIANSITDQSASSNKDETGGTVFCLTEAVMGVTAGLCRVAESISDLAEAVRESKCQPKTP
jgi:phage gp29-like protein